MPEGQPGSDDFPGATHAFTISEQDTEGSSYLSYANNKFEELGFFASSEGQGFSRIYSNPRSILEFPLNMGSAITDS